MTDVKIMFDGELYEMPGGWGSDVTAATEELGLGVSDDIHDDYDVISHDVDGGRPPDESAHDSSDSYAIHRWALRDGRNLYIDMDRGMVVSAGVDGGDIADRLLGWNHDDVPETAEWTAAWGFCGLDYLQEAEEDYEGPCRIWAEPHYCDTCYDAPLPGFLRSDDDPNHGVHRHDDGICVFANYAEAEGYLKRFEVADGDCHRLVYGQYAPDVLTIVKA